MALQRTKCYVCGLPMFFDPRTVPGRVVKARCCSPKRPRMQVRIQESPPLPSVYTNGIEPIEV